MRVGNGPREKGVLKLTKYELTLVHRSTREGSNSFTAHRIERVEADDIISLLAQFQLVIASVLKAEYELIIQELRIGKDDDLPF